MPDGVRTMVVLPANAMPLAKLVALRADRRGAEGAVRRATRLAALRRGDAWATPGRAAPIGAGVAWAFRADAFRDTAPVCRSSEIGQVHRAIRDRMFQTVEQVLVIGRARLDLPNCVTCWRSRRTAALVVPDGGHVRSAQTELASCDRLKALMLARDVGQRSGSGAMKAHDVDDAGMAVR